MIELDKQSATRLLRMIISGLISYKHTMPWCDQHIVDLEEPPVWILELSVSTSKGALEGVVGEYAYSEPFQVFDQVDYGRYQLGCLMHRYFRRELSWASLLEKCGGHSDAAQSTPECEWFYGLLNEYEDSGYCEALESEQLKLVQKELAGPIDEVLEDYRAFRELYPPQTHRRWRGWRRWFGS